MDLLLVDLMPCDSWYNQLGALFLESIWVRIVQLIFAVMIALT